MNSYLYPGLFIDEERHWKTNKTRKNHDLPFLFLFLSVLFRFTHKNVVAVVYSSFLDYGITVWLKVMVRLAYLCFGLASYIFRHLPVAHCILQSGMCRDKPNFMWRAYCICTLKNFVKQKIVFPLYVGSYWKLLRKIPKPPYKNEAIAGDCQPLNGLQVHITTFLSPLQEGVKVFNCVCARQCWFNFSVCLVHSCRVDLFDLRTCLLEAYQNCSAANWNKPH